MAINVLVVDDNALLRMGLTHAIESEDMFSIVGESSNGEEALQLYKKVRPDVVTMDYQMPGIDGATCTKEIIKFDPAAKVILLTVRETVEAKFLILVRITSMPDSSDPLMNRYSAPTSLQSALATVVLPQPAEPQNRKFGSCPLAINSLNVSFKLSGKTHSSIVCGRYFSTQINCSSII